MNSIQKQKKPAVYKTVINVAEILRNLSNGINTVTDIATYSNLSKSTVSRLLDMLVYSNLATYDPIHRRFYLGPLINQLAANPKTNHFRLISISADEMNLLSEISNESIILSILVGITIAHIYTIPSRKDIQVVERKQVFQGATAKTLFSQLDDVELDLIVDAIKLERVTKLSVVDKKDFIQQVQEVREKGYSITCGEAIPGAMAISAPIKNYVFPAILSIIGLESNLKPKTSALMKKLISAANRISDRIAKID